MPNFVKSFGRIKKNSLASRVGSTSKALHKVWTINKSWPIHGSIEQKLNRWIESILCSSKHWYKEWKTNLSNIFHILVITTLVCYYLLCVYHFFGNGKWVFSRYLKICLDWYNFLTELPVVSQDPRHDFFNILIDIASYQCALYLSYSLGNQECCCCHLMEHIVMRKTY